MPALGLSAQSDDATPEVRVQSSRADAPETLTPIERFGSDYITRTDAFTADEVLSQVSADLPTTGQTVLIDGRETQVDISTIPAAMIDHIEVNTNGEMPDGRRVVGNVINVILKKNYNGGELSGRQRNSIDGGGAQSQLYASGGRTLGQLAVRMNATRREQNSLRASERGFSSDQDRTAAGGSDYRAAYGEAPVVQAVVGALNGISDPSGAPASIAFASRAPRTQSLDLADFLAAPAGTLSPAGILRFDTADFLYLIAPSINESVGSEVSWRFDEDTQVRAGYTYQRSTSHQSAPPPITRAGSSSVVPAAYNPFGQDIRIGFVHTGFGPVQRETSTDRHGALLAAEGRLNEEWTWNGKFEKTHRVADSETADLDSVKLAAALADPDPAQRFDPFADSSAGSANAALYPGLTRVRHSVGTSDDTKLRFESRGELSKGWVEPLTLRLGVERNTNESRQEIDPRTSFEPPIDVDSRLTSLQANANLDVPVFRVRELASPAVLTFDGYASSDEQRVTQQTTAGGVDRSSLDMRELSALLSVPWFVPADERTGLRELQTRIGIGAAEVNDNIVATESAGLLWSLSKPYSFRVDYSRQLNPRPTELYSLTVDYNQTLIDRLRSSALADNVEVVSSQPDAQAPPLVTRLQLSAQWTPPALEKLKLTLNYSQVEQQGQRRSFSAQDILDNEAALPGRVTRLPPTDDEVAAGLPGKVARVDITPFSGGQRVDKSLTLRGQYQDKRPDIGTIAWRARAEHLLSSRNQLADGLRVVSTNDLEAPPDWKFWTQADWSRGKWSAATSYTYTSGGQYAGLPFSSFATLDVRGAYQIELPQGGWLGSTLRVGAGIQNLLDRDPPFANTLTGYRGGSPLGRTYEVTLRMPIGD